MTEHEWLAGTDPKPMLEFLRGKASDRKLRLWGCACCEMTRELYPNHEFSTAVRAAERVAEGLAGPEDLQFQRQAVIQAYHDRAPSLTPAVNAIQVRVLEAIAALTSSERCHLEYALWFNVALALEGRRLEELHGDHAAGVLLQWLEATSEYDHKTKQFLRWADIDPRRNIISLLHDIFGNPFRSRAFDPAGRTPNVTAVAQAIYTDRRFAAMAILADALEEAGCTSADILDHCRSGGEHVRGCWVVDLVLGKD